MRREGLSRSVRASRKRSLFLVPVALLVVLAATALTAPAARAEERKHSWEAGFFAGYTIYGGELQLDNGTDYGLRAGWNFAPPYEIELQYFRGSGVNINDVGSTLVDNDAVFLNAPHRDWSPTAYTARFIINPRNERRRLKPYMQMGLGYLDWSPSPSLDKSNEGDLNAYLFSVGGGIRYKLGAYTQIRGEFEDLYAISEVYSNFHLNVGLSWVFGGGRPADTDGDGILDLKDRCPDTPAGALVDKHDGCPWDIDGDGVMEGLDQCPNTPQGWPVDDKGCPLDSDGDAVPDGADQCADTPKGAIVDPNGCPADSDKDGIFDGVDRCAATPQGATVDGLDTATPGCPHDTDGDGVFDGIDQCALTPAGAIVDEKGCPKDSDGDRVLDGIDQCPDSPKGARLDKEGCPRVRLDKAEPQILQNVKFHGMELYPGVDAWLMLLVEAAQYWPDVTFEVGVYTDNEGGVAANRAAAARRAEVLRAWLINQGVPAKQFQTKAYGPVNFIADNATEEGREKNRRVEVKRVSGDIRKHPKPAAEPPPAEQPAAPAEQPEAKPSEAPAEKPPAAEPAPAEKPPAAEPAPAEKPPAGEPAPQEKPPAPAPQPDAAPPDAPQPAPDAPQPPPDAPKPPSGGGA
jgi:OmpA family protein/outer membrane protein with beta-barrel domain/thrombospondin type 3 repeat protein